MPDAAVTGLASAMDDFFGLPLADKLALKVPANRGYSAPKSESLSLSLGVEPANRMNDFFEAFNVGAEARSYAGLDLDEADYGLNVWPDVPGFRERVETWFAEAGRVARTLLRVFTAALELPAGYFADLTDHSIDVLRMNNYALPPGEVTLDGELTGMGEHTDFGLVTVLWADQVAGLQVLDPSPDRRAAGGTTSARSTAPCWSTSVTSPRGSPTTAGPRRCTGSSRPWWTAGSCDAARPRTSTTATSTPS